MNRCLVIPVLLAGCCLASVLQAEETLATWYVSPQGNDAWSGKLEAPNADRTDGPLASLERAVAASRQAGTGPRRVALLPGEHAVTKTITLTDADAGFTLEGLGKERPLLHGGRLLTNWRRDGDTFWAADVPEAKGGGWDFRVLVVDGRIAPRARLPEEGCFEHLSEFNVTYMSAAGGHWQRPPTDEELTTLKYKAEDLGPWLDTNNAELVVFHMWSESLVGLAANDTATRTLRFKTKANSPPGSFRVNRYVVYNVREGLKRPGQWYLDRTAGKVVYWPLPGQDMTRIRVFAPAVQKLIAAQFSKRVEPAKGEGKDGRTSASRRGPCIRHLKLSVTDIPAANAGFGGSAHPAAIELIRADGATLEDLEATALGGWFLKDHESTEVVVRDCHVHHVGTSGIRAGAGSGRIEDNRVHDVGLLCNNGVGLSIAGGSGYRIRRNIVHGTPYSGIIVGGRGNLVEENLVYHAMQVLHDGAAFYCGCSRDLVLRRNVVRDVAAVGKGYGASAYYLDEKSENCLVEGNVSINVGRPTHNHMTVNCTLRNNVFVHDREMVLSFAKSRGFTVEGNVFCSGGNVTVSDPDALTRWSGNFVLQNQSSAAREGVAASLGDHFTPVERKLRKTPKTMTAIRLDARPKADGVFELGEWPDASTSFGETPEQLSGRGAPAVFKACLHDGALCLAVVVVTMDPDRVSKGAQWGRDDAVEVALGGKSADGKPVTWVLRGFAQGQLLSETAGGASPADAQRLLKQIAYKTLTRKQDWRSEWIIPLEPLGVDPAGTDPLPFNVTAWRTENGEFRQYAGSLGKTWDLTYGGRLLPPKKP